MGACNCNSLKDSAAANEVMVPPQQDHSVEKQEYIEEEVNQIAEEVIDEQQEFQRVKTKKNTKKMIKFAKVNNNSSLSPIWNDQTKDIIFKSANAKNSLIENPENAGNGKNDNEIIQGDINCTSTTNKHSGENTNYSDHNHITSNGKKKKNHNIEEITEEIPEDPVTITNNNTNFVCTCIMKVISQDDQKHWNNWWSNHYLFKNYTENTIKAIIEELNLYQIEVDTIIFKEDEQDNNFYIIKTGKVEIKTKNKSKILIQGDSFGELSWVEPGKAKKYTIIAKTQIEIYSLTYDKWTEIWRDQDAEAIVAQTETEENMKIISECYMFHNWTEETRMSMSWLCKRQTFTDSSWMIVSNQVSLHNKGAKRDDAKVKAFWSNSKLIIYVFSGELIESFHAAEIKTTIKPKEFAGIIYTMFKPHEQSEYNISLPDGSSSTCLLIPENIFFETWGTNYRIELLFNWFKAKIIKTDWISSLINQIEQKKEVKGNKEKDIFEQLFQNFSIQDYKAGNVVISRDTYINKKYALVLHGEWIRSSNKTNYASAGKLIGDKFIDSNCDLDYDIISKNNFTLVFECTWKCVWKIFFKYKANSPFFEHFHNISKISIFRDFNESSWIKYAKIVKQITAKKGKVLIKEGTINTSFFFISKGRVKMKTNTMKKIRVYDEGSCFGDYSLLYDLPNVYNFVASANSVLYTLENKDFKELLKEPSANDFIKDKIVIESTEAELKDLYFLSYLGRGRFGNVCWVHNKMIFYAAKAISKLAAEKQKTGVKNLINEKKTMVALDHPFVVKLVKTLKKDNWCFFLQELITGKNFADYLDSRKSKHNVYETKFYAATMLEMISYLNKRSIIHRDIKPNNIMWDSNGYLKLIDFGTSRKLQNYSQTIIGTPNFIAPEIISGKQYSFSIDYWSIGICVYYIYFGILPFGQKAIELLDIYHEIIEMELDFPRDTPPEIKSLLSGLLNKNQSERIQSWNAVKEESLYKDFSWDDLIRFKIKPFYIPSRDDKDNPENWNLLTSPFIEFMESEKFTTIQMQTLKIKNNKEFAKQASVINTKWFDDF